MKETDSPVLRALEENPNGDLINCRWCGTVGHQRIWRWMNYGAGGFCSQECKDAAKEAYASGNLDWWKIYHEKPKKMTLKGSGTWLARLSCLRLSRSKPFEAFDGSGIY